MTAKPIDGSGVGWVTEPQKSVEQCLASGIATVIKTVSAWAYILWKLDQHKLMDDLEKRIVSEFQEIRESEVKPVPAKGDVSGNQLLPGVIPGDRAFSTKTTHQLSGNFTLEKKNDRTHWSKKRPTEKTNSYKDERQC